MTGGWSIVCWGELLWDLFPGGPCLGGAPSNLAVHLAAGGAPTSLITRLGVDELGDRAALELSRRGLRSSHLQRDATMPTGRVGIEVFEGEARYTLHEGAWRRIACDAPARALLARSAAFCYGTLSQESEAGLASWRQALDHLPANVPRLCDPNLRGGRIDAELVREHLQAASIVKINDGEARVFERTFGCSDAARWLLEEMGVDLVALTQGAAGCTLLSADWRHHHRGFVADPGGDNVGAGDAFCSVLLRGVLAGSSLAAIAEAANRYASFVASRPGATPMVPESLLEEVQALLDGRPATGF